MVLYANCSPSQQGTCSNSEQLTIATALNIPTKYRVLDDVLNRIEFLMLCCLLITPQKVMYDSAWGVIIWLFLPCSLYYMWMHDAENGKSVIIPVLVSCGS